MPHPIPTIVAVSIAAFVLPAAGRSWRRRAAHLLEGKAAFGDWHADRPGTRRLIRPQDLPAPDPAASAANTVKSVHRTDAQKPIVPNGFEVNLFAPDLIIRASSGWRRTATCSPPRARPGVSACCGRTASEPNNQRCSHRAFRSVRHRLLSARAQSGMGLCRQHRFRRPLPYRNGDLRRAARPRSSCRICRSAVIVRATSCSRRRADDVRLGRLRLQRREHGKAERRRTLQDWQSAHPLGAAWGRDRPRRRAGLRSAGQERRHLRHRHPQLRRHGDRPRTATLWCSTNERDGLGDNLPPDYMTRVREGAFYGWPWYYIGDNEDPRHKGERPDLKDKITVPDVLIQPIRLRSK
jgi:hypothetical protein